MHTHKPELWRLLCIQKCRHAGPLQGPKVFTAGLFLYASFGRRKLHLEANLEVLR